LCGVLDDGDNSLEFFGGDFTGPFVQVDIGLFADKVGVAATDTLDSSQSVHDLLLAIDVGVQQAENELEVRLLSRYERHDGQLR